MPSFNSAFGDCTGPFGFPMKENAARDLDCFLEANADEDVGYFRKSFSSFEYFIAGENADVSIITDASVDKDKEAVDISSLDFSEFKKNPQVPYAHVYTVPPVGVAQWVKLIKGDRYRAKTVYHERPEGYPSQQVWFPDYVYGLVKSGKLPGKSIGGVASKRAPTDDDLKKNPHWSDASVIRYNGKVHEYSVVGIACNGNSEVEFVAKSLAGLDDQIISRAFPEMIEVVSDLRKQDVEKEIPVIKDFSTVADFESDVSVQLEKELGDIQNRIPELIDSVLKRLLGKVA